MTAASAFSGGFNFLTLALVTGLDEGATLDAVDGALEAQLLQPTGQLDHYDFTHALIRHTLYSEMNPSRQVRLHRQIAEAYEQRNQDQAAKERHAAEVAYQYHRSAAIPGAERGVEYALLAADRAETAFAYDEAAQFLRIALDLLPEADARRPRLLARFATALAWTLQFDEAVATAISAGESIAASEGREAAAEFFKQAVEALFTSGSLRGAWQLAEVGVPYATKGSPVWARLVSADVQRREAHNPNTVGTSMPMDAPEYDEFIATVRKGIGADLTLFASTDRQEALRIAEERASLQREVFDVAFLLCFQVGEFRRARDLFLKYAEESESSGKIALAAGAFALVARCHNALGDLDAAQAVYDHSLALGAKLAGDPLLGAQSIPAQQVLAAFDELRVARGTSGDADGIAIVRGLIAQNQPELQWARSTIDAGGARIMAIAGHADEALAALGALSGRLDRIPAWDGNNVRVLSDAAQALWAMERNDHLDVVERNLRAKVIEPDFRYPSVDGRLAMARLCAVSGRFDEARDWFAKARTVLDEQGARPLRAIVDYDEALMYARRGDDGDAARALPLLEAALRQFADIGMTGWTERAEPLREKLLR